MKSEKKCFLPRNLPTITPLLILEKFDDPHKNYTKNTHTLHNNILISCKFSQRLSAYKALSVKATKTRNAISNQICCLYVKQLDKDQCGVPLLIVCMTVLRSGHKNVIRVEWP